MNTYLLTWNPKHKPTETVRWNSRVVNRLKQRKSVRDQWSTGSSRSIQRDDRVFLLRQGRDRPGMVGAGWATSGWFRDDHWLDAKRHQRIKANYVRVEWDSMVLPDLRFPRAQLLRGIVPQSLVNAQCSGCSLPPEVAARLEMKWEQHLNSKSATGLGKNNWRGPVSHTSDSWDDLDTSNFGSDGSKRRKRIVSHVPRDPKVRRTVLRRSKGICERAGCEEMRSYKGFLDVHHILGAEKGDRVWNCVALCPNCHRETHYSPNRAKLNRQLLRFSAQFK